MEFERLEERALLAADLRITPITWNVLGLDSNRVNTGPDTYLVGARVANVGDAPATNVRADFTFDSDNAYINLTGPAAQSLPALAAGASSDFYYLATVTRTPAAYSTARRYHIAATADGLGSVSTPAPRELFVEQIISQNRNSIIDIGGPTTVFVGQTFQYTLASATAPGGYEQLESFLTFGANFRTLAVTTTYTAPTGGTNDKVYADAGGFQNDPTRPDYRESIGPVNYPGGKAGGVIRSTFTIQALAPGTSSITAAIYDKSGSSYHYNGDYGAVLRTITVVDPPPVAGDDSATTAEDTPIVINLHANDSDPDGNLNPGSTVVISGPSHGTVMLVNGQATYTPAPDFSGMDTFTYRVSDSGSPPGVSNTATVTIRVDPVNDPPVHAVPGTQTIAEDTPLAFSGGNALSIADVDAGVRPVQVTLSAANGTLTLAGTTGLSFLSGDGTSDPAMTFTGTVANIDAALAGLVFTPAANFAGSASLRIITNDLGSTGSGAPLADDDTVSITVTPVNDPPVNTVPGIQATQEGVARIFSAANGNALAIADVDTGSAPVRVTVTVPAGSGTLAAVSTAGVTITANGTGAVTLDGPQAGINAALDGLVFTPAAAFSGTATLTITTDDLGNTGSGGSKTDTATVAIRVSSQNNPPVNTVPGSQSVNEDTLLVFSGAGAIAIADPDAGTSAVQVTLGVTHGTLTLAGTTGLTFSTGDGTTDASMTFTGTIAAINAALNNLTFTPPANSSASATLTITTNDLGHSGTGGPLSDTDSVAIAVNPVNDAPVNNLPADQAVAFNGSLAFSGTNGNPISVADVDAGTGDIQVTLNITPVTTSGAIHKLNLTATGLTSVTGNGSESLVLTGPLSAINTALGTLTFNPKNNFEGTLTLTV
ncbi:MAG TPA: Ig-like domain-containing protein, partial [Isosphaeraceae bacterium]